MVKTVQDLFLIRRVDTIIEAWDNVLVELYLPFLGTKATMLYILLKTIPQKKEPTSHHQLLQQTQLPFEELAPLFKKLEASGLISSYLTKVDEIVVYLYAVHSPMGATDFLKEPMFVRVLSSYIGQESLNQIISRVNQQKQNSQYISSLENISAHFKVVFQEELCGVDEQLTAVDDNLAYEITGQEQYFFDTFYLMIPVSIRESFTFSTSLKQLLGKIAQMYALDSGQMATVFNVAYQKANGKLEEADLRSAAYTLTLTKLRATKSMPSPAASSDGMASIKNEALRKALFLMKAKPTLEYIALLTDNVTPIDVSNVEQLILDYQLKEEVVNVLVDYVYKTNNTLAKPLMVAIAQQWSKQNIDSAEAAYFALKNFAQKAKKRQAEKIAKPNMSFSKKRTEIIPVFEEATSEVDEDLKRAYDEIIKEMEEA
ncbi:MAG: DnaD domain protein [Culicoidibacterales bacterium]